MPLSPKTRLGTYEILGPLGAGGMGEVYRAKDLRLGREVAVKVLSGGLASSPNRLARFEREARTVAGLNHPNIVVLYSIEEARGIRFLTMELVEGRTLDRLAAPGGLPLSLALDVAIPLAEALAAAHERGVVHRDLKPGNVMVTHEGRVKVLDFGLAKLIGQLDESVGEAPESTRDSLLTASGRVVGTAPYMAPEQLRGEEVDSRTDLFALGVVLYELVAGRRPFTGTTSADVSSSILRDTPVPLRSLRSDVPADLDRIVRRCLEKDARARYPSASDLYQELRELKEALGLRSPAAAEPALSSYDKPSIAVLPFVNISHDEDNEYFSDGLAEELLNVLSKIRGLRVAARSSAFTFKGKQATVAEVGHALKVGTVLEGSVRKSGSRVRISVQLVNVSDGFYLWSETYDRTLQDILAVQDDIAQSVVAELRATLMGGAADSVPSTEIEAEVAEAARGRGNHAEAHRLFLQGRHFVDRATREGAEKGIAHLREALALDPGYALAWAELGRAYSLEADQGWAPVEESYARAREAAERALELEPRLAEGHARLGWIQLNYDWSWRAADASYRRALELAPGNAVVLRAAGLAASDLGRQEEALALLRRASEQDPLSHASYHTLGVTCHLAGRLEEAEQAFRTALALSPQGVVARSLLALVLLDQGRAEEALVEAVREPEEESRLRALAMIHHSMGHRAESDDALRELTAKYAESCACRIAEVHAVRGDADSAFEWLERAYAQRDTGLVELMARRELGSMKGDRRWGSFLRKMGFGERVG